jgi:DNA repair exonuclease SbcCD ATPase subunit
MITLQKITIEGFGSIQGPFTYTLDRLGVNLILGENGVGKTTILNALCWCLYKQTLKKGSSIEPWTNNQGKNYRGIMVSVNYSDGKNKYQVTRCKDFKGNIGKPNNKGGDKLFFFKDGELADKKYKSNIQPLIERTLGYSFNLFKNAILFGQEVERLMKESGPNKRKVFEEAFDTSFLEEAREIVNKRLQNSQYDEERLLHNVSVLEKVIKDFDINTKEHVKNKNDNIKRYLKDLKRLRDWVSTTERKQQDEIYLEKRIRRLQLKVEDLQKRTNSSISDEEFRLNMWMNTKQQEWETTWDDVKATLASFRDKLNCPECKRPMSKEHIKNHQKKTAQRLKTLKKKAKKLMAESKELKTKYKKVKEDLAAQKENLLTLQGLKLQLGVLLKQRDTLIAENALLDSRQNQEIPALKKNIQSLKKQKRVLQENRKREKKGLTDNLERMRVELAKRLKKNETDRWLVKDPLSANGIRAYIFDSMLEDLNFHLAVYTPFIGFHIKVYIELETARKDIRICINKKKQEVPYEDLSKGQKQLTDYILALAINDTITSTKPINVFLMDEVFESLSKNNVEIVGNLIMRKSQTCSVHIITHLPSFQPIGAKKTVLQLDKQGNTVKVGE